MPRSAPPRRWRAGSWRRRGSAPPRGGSEPRRSGDVLQRLALTERAQARLVLLDVTHDFVGLEPRQGAQRPADALADEEVLLRHVGLDAAVEQVEVGVA